MKFKPGVSGNPLGRTPLPPEIRAERRKNQANLITLIAKYFSMTSDEATDRLAGPGVLQLEEAIQGVILKAKDGDVNALRYLLEIMVGKVPEQDTEDFSEEDLRILKRVKEVMNEEKKALTHDDS